METSVGRIHAGVRTAVVASVVLSLADNRWTAI
jgi:hypothetical protein